LISFISGGFFTNKMTDIKKAYQALKKKYKLPDFNKLDSTFEISSIESDKFLERSIRRRIAEKLDAYLKSIEGVLYPETTLNNLYESKFFTDKDKEKIFKIYKEMMVFQKRSYIVSTLEDEKEDVKLINDVFERFSDIKSQLRDVFTKMMEGWEKETDIKEDLEYLG